MNSIAVSIDFSFQSSNKLSHSVRIEFWVQLLSTIASHHQGAELSNWKELLPRLVALLDEADLNAVDGSLNALSKICEEATEALDAEELGRPLNVLLPKLLTFFAHPQEAFRRYALGSINQFLITMPNALNVIMEQYLQGLFALAANDTSTEIRKRVCQALVMLCERRLNLLAPFMKDIIRFLLFCTRSDDEALALEACEFWSTYCDCVDADMSLLLEVLPELVPVLMNATVFTELDLAMMSGVDDEDDTPDLPHQLRPTSYHGRVVGGDDEYACQACRSMS
jgi:transportin-1